MSIIIIISSVIITFIIIIINISIIIIIIIIIIIMVIIFARYASRLRQRAAEHQQPHGAPLVPLVAPLQEGVEQDRRREHLEVPGLVRTQR